MCLNYIKFKSYDSQKHRISKPQSKYSIPIDVAIILSYGASDNVMKNSTCK